jgi:hypothetical protein
MQPSPESDLQWRFSEDLHNPTRERGTRGKISKATQLHPSITLRVEITPKIATSKRNLRLWDRGE